jgi:predicted alpha/beta hydrolase
MYFWKKRMGTLFQDQTSTLVATAPRQPCLWCRWSSALFARPGRRRAGASCERRRTPVPLVPCAGAKPPPAASVALVAVVVLLPA